MTHVLLVNSPAITAGDPNFNPDAFDPPLLYDQRNNRGFSAWRTVALTSARSN